MTLESSWSHQVGDLPTAGRTALNCNPPFKKKKKKSVDAKFNKLSDRKVLPRLGWVGEVGLGE